MFRIRLPAKLKKSSSKKNEAKRIALSEPAKPVPCKPYTTESSENYDNAAAKIAHECGYARKRKTSDQDEIVLPGKYEPFPSELYGKPLEEIDNFIYEEVSTRGRCFFCDGDDWRG